MAKRKPKWDEKDAVRRGRAASGLATKFRAQIEPRLEAGAIDGLDTDIAVLDGSKAARVQADTEKKGKTGVKHDAAADAHEFIMDVRESIQRTAGLTDGVRKTFGIGDGLAAGAADKVKGVLQAILQAFTNDPTLPRRIGLLEEDVAEGSRLLASLGGATESQVAAKSAKIEATFDRNVVQMRVEDAVDAISARGRIAFRKDPKVRDRFMALVSSAGPAAEDLEPLPAAGSTTPSAPTPA
jgi:hypothetical protein